MFNLLPWKRRHSDREAYEPTRQNEATQGPLPALRGEFDSTLSRLLDERFSRLSNLLDDNQLGFGKWNMGWEDKQDAFEFHAEIPGFEPEDIDVNVSGHLVTIRAERKSKTKDENGSRYQYGSFRERLTIPQGVKTDQLDAQYRNGVLRLRLPKDESAQGRRITVKSS